MARGYDDWIENAFEKQYITFRKKFISCMSSDDLVLEFGAGTGDIGFNIAPLCKEVIGVDISPEMVEVANRKKDEMGVKNISFQEGDAYDLPFEDSSFDKVICCNVLQTMKEPVRAVQEGKRVLKKGGEFISNTYCFGDSGIIEYLKLTKWVLLYGKPRFWIDFDCVDIEGLFTTNGLNTVESVEIWKSPIVLFLRSKK
jgi:ubiquinone/menaquinone biosynthesis C-methylase UbiE